MRPALLLLPGLLLGMAALSPSVRADSLLVKYDRLRGSLSIEAKNADARRVVQEIFNQSGGAPYMLAPDFAGRVTVRIYDAAPETALRIVLKKVDGDFRILGRTYHVFHRKRVFEDGACRKCRYERKREWRFCPMCGVRLTEH